MPQSTFSHIGSGFHEHNKAVVIEKSVPFYKYTTSSIFDLSWPSGLWRSDADFQVKTVDLAVNPK